MKKVYLGFFIIFILFDSIRDRQIFFFKSDLITCLECCLIHLNFYMYLNKLVPTVVYDFKYAKFKYLCSAFHWTFICPSLFSFSSQLCWDISNIWFHVHLKCKKWWFATNADTHMYILQSDYKIRFINMSSLHIITYFGENI